MGKHEVIRAQLHRYTERLVNRYTVDTCTGHVSTVYLTVASIHTNSGASVVLVVM